MFHSDDYISLFVPFFDIPVSLGHLFQQIALNNHDIVGRRAITTSYAH